MKELEEAVKKLNDYFLVIVHDVFSYQPACIPIALIHKSAIDKVRIVKDTGIEVIDLGKTEKAIQRLKELSILVWGFVLEQAQVEW